ncbi:hypothetical protein [Actinoallomurus iriomotensis]|uniref:Uncharacterized protein n=1 Tax=Actinoallomurus iriomotensis TaxID=478107 RepID=A0A9W6S043_9ACTN|nr:hypothetical protein [Actinoallomurus iriomotensis]GLY83222.1 hypothetical protein Airi02_011520 [Actinoallomurus iriomotensis]
MLRGMDRLFEDLVAPLVGIDPVRFHRIPWRAGDDVPVVLFDGGPGMGKTVALEWIAECYRNRAPIARVDLADGRYPEGAEDCLPRLLTDLRWLAPWGLAPEVDGNGPPLGLPRVSAALLAIAIGPPTDRLDDLAAHQRLESALRRVYPSAEKGEIKGWMGEVLSEIAGHLAPFPADVLIKATVAVLLRRLFHRSRLRAVLNWHATFSRGPGEGWNALIALSADFHRKGLPRKAAEKALVAAFLEDVWREYHGAPGLRRTARPVVLLDNADAHPVGERFLDLVLGRRATEKVDPLIVIAAGEHGLAGRHRAHATRTTSRYPLDARRWTRPGNGQAGAGLLAVEFSRLEPELVSEMLRGVDLPDGRTDDDRLIHRLTGGLPLGADVITTALAAAGGRTDGTHGLVDLPSPDDHRTPVVSDLLRDLVPSARWRTRLVTLAAALDRAAAGELLPHNTVFDAAKLLRRHDWGHDAEHFVGDRFLRVLLLRELYSRQAGPTWTDVHERLRDFHARHGDDGLDPHEARRLHHCLALGDVGTVVRKLDDELADAADWLVALCVISEAPYFDRPDVRRAAALGAGMPDAGEPAVRLVTRILYATWYLRDPFVPPDGEVIDGLERDLEHLAERPGIDGVDALLRAADLWPKWLRDWNQDLCSWPQGE